MKAEGDDTLDEESRHARALLERRRRLFPFEPEPSSATSSSSSAMHQWAERKYAQLKEAWTKTDSVIWRGEEDTAGFTARLTCQAWVYEMLVCDPDPSIKKIVLFAETGVDAACVIKGLHDMLIANNVPLLQVNCGCIRTVAGRTFECVGMSLHTTRGLGGERLILLIHDNSQHANPDVVRFMRDVIMPLLDLTLAKLVVYGIPRR